MYPLLHWTIRIHQYSNSGNAFVFKNFIGKPYLHAASLPLSEILYVYKKVYSLEYISPFKSVIPFSLNEKLPLNLDISVPQAPGY
jgi:hypothetical protein